MARHGLFAVLSFLAFILPAPAPRPSAASFVNPTLNRLSSQLNELQADLSAVGIQRTTVMRDPALRAKLLQFWSIAQREGDLAHADAEVQRLIQDMELQEARPAQGSENGQVAEDEPTQVGRERLEAQAFADMTVERLLQSLAPP